MTNLRNTPAASLMRQAQNAPDRPGRKAQINLDTETWIAIEAAAAASMPKMSPYEWMRAAIREKLVRGAG